MAGKMNKAKWIKVGLQIVEPLKELRRIAAENGLDMLSIAVFGSKDDVSYATYIDGNPFDDDSVHYDVNVCKDKVTLSTDNDTYYTQT